MREQGSVLVGVDGSAESLAAVRWAAEEARRRNRPLRLVAAIAPNTRALAGVGGADRDDGYQLLSDAALEALGSAADLAHDIVLTQPVDREIRDADPADVLVEESDTAALVVVGHRGGGGFAGLLLGSVGVAVAARAASPVVVVRGRATADGPVVVGVGGPGSEVALDFAFTQADRATLPLLAVHTWSESTVDPFLLPSLDWPAIEAGEKAGLAAALEELRGRHPDVPVRTVVARDGAARALVQNAHGASLLVVGARGDGTVPGLLLGTVAQSVLHHAPCPVAVVPAVSTDEE